MTPRRELPFVDIHCHLLPGIDDGSDSWDTTLAMAQQAVDDGIETIVVTPHQLGNYNCNHGDAIRHLVAETRDFLAQHQVPLRIEPGADVRIEPEMIAGLQSGEVVSLADHRKHVLLELPHELYFSIDRVLDQLHHHGMTGILSHPERNQGILQSPHVVEPLVRQGCLMQITAASLIGTFGPDCQRMSEWLLNEGLVHFISTDAHSTRSRRPNLSRAFEAASEIAGDEIALDLCCRNPACVVNGQDVQPLIRPVKANSKGLFASLFGKR
ncbi:MAG: hypothetical protein HKN47_07350 [Pirellulaceae bacterium]|nr:hypothetical protein [Pirellulaceae bacterium]